MNEPTHILLERVREAVAGTYDLLGELGREEGHTLFLAREVATGVLVAVAIVPEDPDAAEVTVETRRTLGITVAVKGSACPECGTELPDLERFCFHCGADLSGVAIPEGSRDSERLLAALTEATAGRFEILGRMEREGGAGTVYLARSLADGQILALRLRRAEPRDAVKAEFVVGQTQMFRPDVPTPAAAPPPSLPPSLPHYASAIEVVAPPPSVAAPSASRAGFGDLAYADPTPTAPPPPPPAPPAPRRSLLIPVLAGAAVVLIGVIGWLATDNADDDEVVAVDSTAIEAARQVAAVEARRRLQDDSVRADSVRRADSARLAAAPVDTDDAGTARADSGTVRVIGTIPDDARVSLDGRALRGRSIRVPVGTHTLAVSARGFAPFLQRVRVRAGGDHPVRLALVPSTAAAGTTSPSTTTNAPASATANCRTATRAESWASALTLCTAEANAGDAGAAATVARLHQRGLGTRADAAQAFTWFLRAANGGVREAQTAVGYMYRDGTGTRTDANRSTAMFKRAADQGDRAAQLEYAVALERGSGVGKDERGAREWYRKAADAGDFMAARRLARLMERGGGGPRSDADAAVMYERAASLGDPESALTIARWYRDGKGVTRSPSQAMTWMRKAVELGNRQAVEELKRLEKGN